MKVVCIFPVTNNVEKMPNIVATFRENIAPQLCIMGALSPEIKFAGTDYIFVETNQTLEGKPKGEGILSCLKNVSKAPDFVICCDGSDKIPYLYIVDVFKELTSDSTIACVMANRIENKAISPERYIIERFEVFCLKNHNNHPKNVLDGQCGLWGYRYGKFIVNSEEKEIVLSSEGYEIELDLLSEVLSKNLNYSFIDVKLNVPKNAKTGFSRQDHIKKMLFIFRKHQKIKSCLSDYLDSFEKTDEFKQLFKDELKSEWESYKDELLKLAKS
ncbi:hypothetical protein HYV85_00155 [Candidatus Woesearchaeota archaeon]|nr:hypothetical protein [Candidatus Woesearchaeota archaeon]